MLFHLKDVVPRTKPGNMSLVAWPLDPQANISIIVKCWVLASEDSKTTLFAETNMIKPPLLAAASSSAGSSDQQGDGFTTADDWFAGGRRVRYDPNRKRIVEVSKQAPSTIGVFERVYLPVLPREQTKWATFLPGFPDGSYGYHKVEQKLRTEMTPRLYIEYVGQGDSDNPRRYTHSTIDRADLVEAQWISHNVRRTVVVTFDYSSLVMLELMQRQKERSAMGIRFPRIEHVLVINGGLFVDGHSHPFVTTPLVKTRFGKMGSSMAQHSNFVLDKMILPLYSKEYQATKLSRQELRETEKAIRRNKGASFLSNAAGFVDEHKQNAKRWDLRNVYVDFCKDQGITFHIVVSAKDQFEKYRIELARERLADYYPGVKIENIPGGHLSMVEQTDQIVEFVHVLVRVGSTNTEPTTSWTKRSSTEVSPLVAPTFIPPSLSSVG